MTFPFAKRGTKATQDDPDFSEYMRIWIEYDELVGKNNLVVCQQINDLFKDKILAGFVYKGALELLEKESLFVADKHVYERFLDVLTFVHQKKDLEKRNALLDHYHLDKGAGDEYLVLIDRTVFVEPSGMCASERDACRIFDCL